MKLNFTKIVKFKNKWGKLCAYIARFENGFMVEEDYKEIQKIINCEK